MLNNFKEMLLLQNKLNNDTCGINWATTKETSEGRSISWKRCIYMEGAEFIDSFNWKHWKDISQAHDVANAQIELVDIWHFIMSAYIEKAGGKNISAIARHIQSVVDAASADNPVKEDFNHAIKQMEDVIHIASSSTDNFLKKLDSLLTHFVKACHNTALSFESLYALYIGKNILNLFRQSNGYKDGSYIKIWKGKEDNVVMQEYLEEFPDASAEQLLFFLQKEYKNIK